MPTSITVPTVDRVKSIEFGAAYSPAESFNPNNALIAAGSGILDGLGLTINIIPSPPEVTVAAGSFLQRGVIVKITAPQLVQAPNPQIYPLYLVAENTDEMHTSAVQILFTTTPNPDSVILAFWPNAPFTGAMIPGAMSLTRLRDAIAGIVALVIQRDRQVAGGGQTVFTLVLAKAYTPGANKLFVYRNGKHLENVNDYSEDSPTQFTLLNPSTAGDVLDIIVFQGSPPITSLALANLTDVTSDLANAIKDTLALRAPANANNPLATLDDIIAGTGTVGALEKREAVVTSGSFVTNATPVVITGSTINFSLPVDQEVAFDGFATNYYNAGSLNRRDGQIGLRLDGIDYWGTFMGSSGLGYYGNDGITISRAFSLLSGAHTASLILRSPNGFLTNVAPTVDNPAVLRILFTTPQATVDIGMAALTKQDAENTTGVVTSNATAVYALVPGTLITLNLALPQVVLLEAIGTILQTTTPDANGIYGQLGIRVDGVDYNGTSVCWDTIYTHLREGLVAHKAVLLSAGIHTIQLVFRNPIGPPRDGRLANSVESPTRLTAIYTKAQALIESILDKVVDAASGDFNVPGGAYVVVPAPTLNFTQIATGDVEATLNARAQQNGGLTVNTKVALILDGITTIVVGEVQISAAGILQIPCGGTVVFPAVAPGAHTLQVAIAAGAVGGDAIIKRSTDCPLTLLARHM